MKTINSLQSLALAGLVFMAGLSAPAHAAPPLDIADRPLYLQGKVPPAFIMALDDSGSMRFQTLFPGFDGTVHWGRDSSSGAGNVYSFFHSTGTKGGLRTPATGRQFVQVAPYPAPRNGTQTNDNAAIPPLDEYGFSRSHVYNPAYFNPTLTYQPWRKADGEFLENASPTAARVERNNAANTTTINLTAIYKPARPGSVTTQNDVRFRVRTGMVLPKGMEYRLDATGSSARCGLTNTGTSNWVVLSSNFTATGDCNIYISYFPATFYLPKDDPAPAGYRTDDIYRPIIQNACTFRTATGTDRCDMRRYEIKPGNYTSTADYNAAIQNFANWFVYYGNRTRAIIAGTTHSLYDVDTMRVGAFTIGNRPSGTSLVMRDMSVIEDKEILFDYLHAHNSVPGRGTTNLPAVKAMGEQFRRKVSGTGANANAPVQLACQVNAGMLFTDGFANQEETMAAPGSMGAPFDTIKANSMAAIAAEYYTKSLNADLKQDQVPVSSGCSEPGAANNPKLDCNAFPHMNLHGVTLGSFGDLIGRTYGVSADGKIDPDLALDQVIANPPTWPGYVGSSRSTVDDLWHATIVSRGRFINASSPAEITNAMTQILNAVIDRASVSGGTAASGTRREDGFLAYVPHYDTADWTGNLKAHTLTAAGALGAVQWDAAALLAARPISDRKVYFVDAGGTVREFTSSGANLPARTLASMDALVAEMCPAAECTRADLINYLRGDHSMEQRNGGPFRDRKSRIGDILGSQPEVLSKASYGYSGLPDDMGGDSYNTFLTGTKSSRTPLVFVGSNNGMLHAFNGQTGQEVYALIPHSVLVDNLKSDGTAELPGRAVFADLADPGSEDRAGSGYDHRYFVDGSPRQGDVYTGGSWKTVLAVPMGAGGRSMLVLDVTNGASASTPNVIAEASHADLGYAVDRPRIVPLKDKSWRVLFGNGYNSNNNTAYLFSLNLNGGSLNRHPVGSAGDGTADSPNGMASVAAADDNADGLADAIYAGDYKGNIWKIPVSSSGFDSVTQPFFQARDDAGNVQHITGGIDVTMHPSKGQIVYFGTGRYLLNVDRSLLENPPVETFYGVWDKGWSVSGTATAPTATLTRSDLTEQDLLAEFDTAGRTLRKTSKKPVPWGVSSGWYLDLAAGGTASGERFVGVPVVALGQVIFTTFEPNSDSDECAASGTNWLNVVDASTGVGGLQLDGHSDVVSIKLPDGSSGGGPVGTPPVVTTPPNDECDPAVEDCGVPEPDEETGVVSPVGAPECNNDLGILLADGVLNFAQLTCGRQSWRQVD